MVPSTNRSPGRDGDQLDPQLLVVGYLLLHAGVNPSVHAAPAPCLHHTGDDVVHNLPYLGSVGHAHRLPQILGSDLEGVDMGDGKDVGQVLYSLQLFHLKYDQSLAVGDLSILFLGVPDAVVAGAGDGVEGAVALRVEATGVDHPRGLRYRIDLRHMDALRPSVQQPQDEVGIVGHPHDGCDVVILGGPGWHEERPARRTPRVRGRRSRSRNPRPPAARPYRGSRSRQTPPKAHSPRCSLAFVLFVRIAFSLGISQVHSNLRPATGHPSAPTVFLVVGF